MDLDREIRELKAIATLYHRRGRFDLAVEILHSALAIESSSYTERSLPAAVTLYQIGEMLCDAGKYVDAKPYFEKAITIWQELHPTDTESMVYHSNALTRLQEHAKHEATLQDKRRDAA